MWVSNIVARRQSLADRGLKFVEHEIPATRMKVRLEIDATVIVKKRAGGIHDT